MSEEWKCLCEMTYSISCATEWFIIKWVPLRVDLIGNSSYSYWNTTILVKEVSDEKFLNTHCTLIFQWDFFYMFPTLFPIKQYCGNRLNKNYKKKVQNRTRYHKLPTTDLNVITKTMQNNLLEKTVGDGEPTWEMS
jgi:hypothetical protein